MILSRDEVDAVTAVPAAADQAEVRYDAGRDGDRDSAVKAAALAGDHHVATPTPTAMRSQRISQFNGCP